MDLSFGLYTLEEIFKTIGDKNEFCTAPFFKNVHYELQNNKAKVLDEILNDNISILTKETYLQNREVDELRKLLLTLGKSDIESQERMIELSIENLKKLTNETEDDINKKGMVYRKLSTIMGLIVGMILI